MIPDGINGGLSINLGFFLAKKETSMSDEKVTSDTVFRKMTGRKPKITPKRTEKLMKKGFSNVRSNGFFEAPRSFNKEGSAPGGESWDKHVVKSSNKKLPLSDRVRQRRNTNRLKKKGLVGSILSIN